MNFKPASNATEAIKINPKAPGKQNKIYPDIMKIRLLQKYVWLQYLLPENPVFMGTRCVNFDSNVGPKNDLETRPKKQDWKLGAKQTLKMAAQNATKIG